MQGDNTLCLPGTDHASIAVQTIIEKQLKNEGKNRYDLGREKFLERSMAVERNVGAAQLSTSLSGSVFLLTGRESDLPLMTVSHKQFAPLLYSFTKKANYRGNYLVNWCPAFSVCRIRFRSRKSRGQRQFMALALSSHRRQWLCGSGDNSTRNDVGRHRSSGEPQ